MRVLAALASLAALAYGAQSHTGHPTPYIAAHAKCTWIGQWFNVEDKKKLPWLGLRMANVHPADYLTLVLKSGSSTRRFSLPFTSSTNKGSHWVRMNLEKSGWDFILVEAPMFSRSGSCSWSLTSRSGATEVEGKVSFKPKQENPFAPPEGRLQNQRNHPGKPRPKHR